MSRTRTTELPGEPRGARAFSIADGLVLGAALVAGWVLHDLAVFLARVDPRAAREILPGSLVCIGAGALAGLVAGLRARLALVASAVGLILCVVLARRDLSTVTSAAAWLPRAALLLLLALAAGRALSSVRRADGQRLLAPSRAGLALGVLAGGYAALVARQSPGLKPVPGPLLGLLLRHLRGVQPETAALLAGALVALSLGIVARPLVRRVATGLVVLACALLVLQVGRQRSALSRPDLAPPDATGGGPNLVLVVLDTVTATHLAPYGYGRETTPNLDRFVADEATLYPDVRSTSSWTLPSHASMFTGLMPGEHGATHQRAPPGVSQRVWPARPLRTDVRTLAEELRQRGYETGAIVANGVALRHQYGVDRGFEHYDDRLGGSLKSQIALAQMAGFAPRSGHFAYRDARQITDLALDWVASRRQREGPFFLFVNYMDAHVPYLPPAPFDRAFDPARPADPLNAPRAMTPLLYDRELLGLDSQVGRLLDALRERRLWEDTAVVVTSDHGEAFGQHGFWHHDFALYDQQIRVPLYVKPPHGRTAERVDQATSGRDVFGLSLGMLGIRPPPAPARDLPIVAEWYQQDIAAVGEWEEFLKEVDVQRDLVSWIEDGRKTIVSSRGDVETYDLASDPGEDHPLALDEEESARARARAQQWWSTHERPVVELEKIDDVSLQALQGLGYTAGGNQSDRREKDAQAPPPPSPDPPSGRRPKK